MKVDRFLVPVFAILLLSGCSSYRFQGNISSTSNTTLVAEKKYRLNTFLDKTDNGCSSMGHAAFTDPWSLAGAANRLCSSDICSAVMLSNPHVFSQAEGSIPLTVEINTRSETKEGSWTILFPYLLTLSIFPTHIHTPSQCDVTVIYFNDCNIRQSCSVDFRTESKLSVLSTLGMSSFDATPGAVSCRSGTGIMMAPHLDSGCRSDLQRVFTETLSAAIIKCIQELETRSSVKAPTRTKPVAPESSSVIVKMPTDVIEIPPAAVTPPVEVKSPTVVAEKIPTVTETPSVDVKSPSAVTEKTPVAMQVQSVPQETPSATVGEDALIKKLKLLKSARQENLLSEQEYQQKRAELLKGL